ncbi:MAG: serine/threonine-protein phosphatase [Eubacterium sp.]|nr:serine/threonine-protein phosphatase [Eubacterium sp.]
MNEEWDIATVRVNPSVIEEYSAQMMDDHPSIKVGVSSVIGTRKYQQDTVFANVDNDVAVGIVCDGMGGLEGGEVASQKATMTFAEDFYAWMNSNEFHEDGVLRFMKDEAVRMDKVITGLKNASGEFLDAGTTVVAAVVFGNRMYWLSVGDSRIYLLRDGKIQKLTRDHNVRLLIDEERKRGIISQDEYERKARNAEGLISYLGIGEVELIDTNEGGVPIVLEENDIIILCSDGVYKRLTDEAVGEIVWCEEPDMERAAKHLTDVVMQYTKNSQDNTSIVLMQYNHYLS